MQLNKIPFALCLAASLSACVVDDGNDTDVADTGTDPSTTMTTDPSTTMTTDPSTTMTTDPSTTTDPATTDPSTSTDPATTDPGTESESETDVSTSVADSTGTDTGPIGMCGWDVKSMFYACGFEGEDPEGNFPLECAEEPVAGGECDENSAINGIGCCFGGGNAFCGKDGTIQIDDSCAAG